LRKCINKGKGTDRTVRSVPKALPIVMKQPESMTERA
jgi:hypothetical protein